MCQISKKLSELSIEELAWEEGFYKRTPRKITATNFLKSFFKGLCRGQRLSLSQWAMNLFLENVEQGIENREPSVQGLEKRLGFSRVPFAQALLQKSLAHRLHACMGEESFARKKLFRHFNRVLVQDSVCFNLPANLSAFFKGSRRKSGVSNATARVTALIDVFAQQYLEFDLRPYCENDQSHTADILPWIKKDDLVIRDMGYFSTATFKAIEQKGAYFLSRLKFPITAYETDEDEPLNIMKLLRKAKQKGWTYVDLPIRITAEHKFACRLVAIKVPPEVAQERRRKARNSRNNQNHYTSEHFERMDWNILITNVPPDIWKPMQVARVYVLRWQIEMIFKTWKSGLGLHRQFIGIQSLSPPKVQIITYLFLSWMTLFFQGAYHFFYKALIVSNQCWLSLAKFASIFKHLFPMLLVSENWETYVLALAKYAAYQKRKDREHFWETVTSNKFKSSMYSL